MSLGNIKKAAANFQTGLRIYNFSKGFKPFCAASVVDTSKSNDVLLLNEKLNQLSLSKSSVKIICSTFPQTYVAIRKNIIELPKITNISLELPIRNSKDIVLDFPLYIEKEISEPGGKVNSKKARHIVAIRRRKMKKHKREKFKRKYKVDILTRKLKQKLAKEAALENSLKTIVSQMETFSAENYMNETLYKVHWQKPVTRVKGFLAPKWVIKKYLEEEEERRIFKKRIKDCIK